jgi:hypothetical protein
MVNARHPPEWRPQQVVQIAMKGNDHGKRRSLRGVEMDSCRGLFPSFSLEPKSCNHLVFASQYGRIGCVGVRLFMLSVVQLRLR